MKSRSDTQQEEGLDAFNNRNKASSEPQNKLTGEMKMQSGRAKQQEYEHMKNYVDKCERVLDEFIPLCTLVSATYVSDAKEDGASEDLDAQAFLNLNIQPRLSTLKQIYAMIENMGSDFIRQSLFEKFNSNNHNERMYAYALLRKIFKQWGRRQHLDGMEFITPVEDPLLQDNPLSPDEAMIDKLFSTLLSPNAAKEKDATGYHDYKRKIPVHEFIQMDDLSILFLLNAYHLPGVGGHLTRGVFEKSINSFLEIFKQVIPDDDFRLIVEDQRHRFDDEKAYGLYFLEKIVRDISTFSKYTVLVVDGVCDIVVDSWKKTKELIMFKHGDNPQELDFYHRMEAKISILNRMRSDPMFKELRTTPASQSIGSNSESMLDKFMGINVRIESIDNESEFVWEETIEEMMLHHPVSVGGEASDGLSQYNQICVGLQYCIRNVLHCIANIKPLLVDQKVDSFAQACAQILKDYDAFIASGSSFKIQDVQVNKSPRFPSPSSDSPVMARKGHHRTKSAVKQISPPKFIKAKSMQNLKQADVLETDAPLPPRSVEKVASGGKSARSSGPARRVVRYRRDSIYKRNAPIRGADVAQGEPQRKSPNSKN